MLSTIIGKEFVRVRAIIAGQTRWARQLALLLTDRRWDVTSFVDAADGKLPVGRIRLGGWGSTSGLARLILDEEVDVVVDATDGFDVAVTRQIVEACRYTRRPALALYDAPIDDEVRALHLADAGAAASHVAREYHHILIDEVVNDVAPFCDDPHNLYVIVGARPSSSRLPARHRITDDTADECMARSCLNGNQIDILVTKNRRRRWQAPLLRAARKLALPIIVVDAPTPEIVGEHLVVTHDPRRAVHFLEHLNNH